MKTYLNKLLRHGELSADETRQILLDITEEKYPSEQIASLLAMLQFRGVTIDELIGFRQALMETRVPVDLAPYKPIDIVGTGGDGKNTFNISTCSCFVVAGAGYKVAKHGNYAATSVSGASTVMQQHGVVFKSDRDSLLRSIEECNMVYLHAQLFAKAMKFVGPVRKAVQFPTVFNLLGPVINPCQPSYQLLGVANLEQMRLYVNTLNRLGIRYAVVTSLDGYDEISLTSGFKIATTDYEHLYRPEDLGFKTVSQESLYGGDTPEKAAKIFDNVLENKATLAQTQAVIANSAVAIKVMEPQKSIEECISIARESLESGKALKCFRKFVEINR
ncbi:MAG: anthranilate phosphoribosyltransferase [Bacteroidales bacterium]|nr:anthranilate phosphoribosyltransferase [Bacteroidales bacterium]MBP5741282.1 anthranilate phosphoribosyltransferase [Bacteroidales bacterium]